MFTSFPSPSVVGAAHRGLAAFKEPVWDSSPPGSVSGDHEGEGKEERVVLKGYLKTSR
jgi:hypothetical protein